MYDGIHMQVSVPCSSMFNIVTVRCGHCANLLSVNMGSSLQTIPVQDPQVYIHVYIKFFFSLHLADILMPE